MYDVTAGIPAVIEEVTPSGSVYYIRGPNGALIARVAGGTTHYYHFDALGSTRLLTDDGGAVTDKYSYHAWGTTTHETGTTAQPYQYVGQLGYYTHVQDANMDLLQLGVRFYDPETGRFTQVDPIRDGWNWYVYANDLPTRRVDPTGLRGKWNPDDFQIIRCMKKWAKWAEKNIGPREYGKDFDKVRHCFVSCKGVKDCKKGADSVLLVGFLKECKDACPGDPGDASWGDMWANIVGTHIACAPNSQCLRDCAKRFGNSK